MMVGGRRSMAVGLLLSCTAAFCQGQEIWQPETNATWQWQLQYEINTSFKVDMYDVDLFDVDTSVFDEIKAMGSVVICYFSAGSMEDWREDAGDFPEEALGEPLEDWYGEVWVDVNNEEVRAIMADRLDLAAEKGCDGVEPDNVQVYVEAQWVDTGVSVTAEDQLEYNQFLATEAHSRNLSIGLKNDLDHVTDLEPFFDWAINESCMQYNECNAYTSSFIAAGKAVFNAEYGNSDLDFCPEANALGISSLLKSYDLGPERCSCQDPSTNNNCAALLEAGLDYEQPSSVTNPVSSSEEEEEADDTTAGASALHRDLSPWTALAVGAAAVAVSAVKKAGNKV